jgi:hypothetical protein
MAIYRINVQSNASVLDGVESALTAAGILEQKYFEDADALIVKTTLCNKVIRFQTSYTRILVQVGDSWTSGDAITNSVQILSDGEGSVLGANVIITSSLFCVGYYTGNPMVANAIFTRMDSATQEYVVLGIEWGSPSAAGSCRDLTNNATIDVRMLSGMAMSGDGYCTAPLFCMTSGGVLLAQGIQGIKAVLVPNLQTQHYVRYADDVVIPGGNANNTNNYFPWSFVIENGASWTPA